MIERLMDWSARDLGLDPVELRRRNFIPRDRFPYRSVARETYDVGDFGRVLDRALARGRRGRLRGAQGGERQGRPAARPRPRLLHRVDPRRPERDDDDRLRRGRHGRAARRHPVERPGPRDGVRADPARADRHPVREHPLRAGRQRPHRAGRRHRRLAVGDHAGQFDQPRRRRDDRALPAAGRGGARGRRRRPRLRGGRLPHRRHRPERRPDAPRRGGAARPAAPSFSSPPASSWCPAAPIPTARTSPRSRSIRPPGSSRW